ncbi:hypothetical protein DE146DRAFT_654916 [Phaeosphaeria sp. MPI-PUGE-AT-0046c]|nr:hypothetical protein DE146DRAFT_654916 [Phaeosphaeria sp. MPI-PUGE-AT-0046c]
MLSSRAQRLPWQSTWLLFATGATAAMTITPSNTSTLDSSLFQGTLPLTHSNGDQGHIADLIPLTRQAAQQTVEGSLYNINSSTVAGITDGQVAFINCNTADFPGYVNPTSLFQDAYKAANISAVILYSTVSDYCAYQSNNNQQMLQDFAVFSMTNQQASASLLNDVGKSSTLPIKVQGRGDGNSNNGGFVQQNPLGPSPSTAVAMIILYSITGIITALFLVIIVTGAVRAHRHPERYGPRNVLGRPRQSRARGLGRAILETIPIVKFGEKEPTKPTDVELASTAETSRSVNAVTTPGTQADGTTSASDDTPSTAGTTDATQANTLPSAEEHQEGIAAAQPVATAAAAAGKDSSSHDDTLGCSICTEDFEKGQDLRVLPCDHKFHPECVDPWLLNVSGTCPLCRVDLRPVTSNDSSASHPDDLTTTAPDAAEVEAEASQRHRTAFRDMLSLRYRPNATPQERIFYLRRLRDQRRNRGIEAAENRASAATAGSSEDAADRRRSKRMSARLSGVFGGRTRRDRSPQQNGESSRDVQQEQRHEERGTDEASGNGPSNPRGT